jgi:hypothetical protein
MRYIKILQPAPGILNGVIVLAKELGNASLNKAQAFIAFMHVEYGPRFEATRNSEIPGQIFKRLFTDHNVCYRSSNVTPLLVIKRDPPVGACGFLPGWIPPEVTI